MLNNFAGIKVNKDSITIFKDGKFIELNKTEVAFIYLELSKYFQNKKK